MGNDFSRHNAWRDEFVYSLLVGTDTQYDKLYTTLNKSGHSLLGFADPTHSLPLDDKNEKNDKNEKATSSTLLELVKLHKNTPTKTHQRDAYKQFIPLMAAISKEPQLKLLILMLRHGCSVNPYTYHLSAQVKSKAEYSSTLGGCIYKNNFITPILTAFHTNLPKPWKLLSTLQSDTSNQQRKYVPKLIQWLGSNNLLEKLAPTSYKEILSVNPFYASFSKFPRARTIVTQFSQLEPDNDSLYSLSILKQPHGTQNKFRENWNNHLLAIFLSSGVDLWQTPLLPDNQLLQLIPRDQWLTKKLKQHDKSKLITTSLLPDSPPAKQGTLPNTSNNNNNTNSTGSKGTQSNTTNNNNDTSPFDDYSTIVHIPHSKERHDPNNASMKDDLNSEEPQHQPNYQFLGAFSESNLFLIQVYKDYNLKENNHHINILSALLRHNNPAFLEALFSGKQNMISKSLSKYNPIIIKNDFVAYMNITAASRIDHILWYILENVHPDPYDETEVTPFDQTIIKSTSSGLLNTNTNKNHSQEMEKLSMYEQNLTFIIHSSNIDYTVLNHHGCTILHYAILRQLSPYLVLLIYKKCTEYYNNLLIQDGPKFIPDTFTYTHTMNASLPISAQIKNKKPFHIVNHQDHFGRTPLMLLLSSPIFLQRYRGVILDMLNEPLLDVTLVDFSMNFQNWVLLQQYQDEAYYESQRRLKLEDPYFSHDGQLLKAAFTSNLYDMVYDQLSFQWHEEAEAQLLYEGILNLDGKKGKTLTAETKLNASRGENDSFSLGFFDTDKPSPKNKNKNNIPSPTNGINSLLVNSTPKQPIPAFVKVLHFCFHTLPIPRSHLTPHNPITNANGTTKIHPTVIKLRLPPWITQNNNNHLSNEFLNNDDHISFLRLHSRNSASVRYLFEFQDDNNNTTNTNQNNNNTKQPRSSPKFDTHQSTVVLTNTSNIKIFGVEPGPLSKIDDFEDSAYLKEFSVENLKKNAGSPLLPPTSLSQRSSTPTSTVTSPTSPNKVLSPTQGTANLVVRTNTNKMTPLQVDLSNFPKQLVLSNKNSPTNDINNTLLFPPKGPLDINSLSPPQHNRSQFQQTTSIVLIENDNSDGSDDEHQSMTSSIGSRDTNSTKFKSRYLTHMDDCITSPTYFSDNLKSDTKDSTTSIATSSSTTSPSPFPTPQPYPTQSNSTEFQYLIKPTSPSIFTSNLQQLKLGSNSGSYPHGTALPPVPTDELPALIAYDYNDDNTSNSNRASTTSGATTTTGDEFIPIGNAPNLKSIAHTNNSHHDNKSSSSTTHSTQDTKSTSSKQQQTTPTSPNPDDIFPSLLGSDDIGDLLMGSTSMILNDNQNLFDTFRDVILTNDRDAQRSRSQLNVAFSLQQQTQSLDHSVLLQRSSQPDDINNNNVPFISPKRANRLNTRNGLQILSVTGIPIHDDDTGLHHSNSSASDIPTSPTNNTPLLTSNNNTNNNSSSINNIPTSDKPTAFSRGQKHNLTSTTTKTHAHLLSSPTHGQTNQNEQHCPYSPLEGSDDDDDLFTSNTQIVPSKTFFTQQKQRQHSASLSHSTSNINGTSASRDDSASKEDDLKPISLHTNVISHSNTSNTPQTNSSIVYLIDQNLTTTTSQQNISNSTPLSLLSPQQQDDDVISPMKSPLLSQSKQPAIPKRPVGRNTIIGETPSSSVPIISFHRLPTAIETGEDGAPSINFSPTLTKVRSNNNHTPSQFPSPQQQMVPRPSISEKRVSISLHNQLGPRHELQDEFDYLDILIPKAISYAKKNLSGLNNCTIFHYFFRSHIDYILSPSANHNKIKPIDFIQQQQIYQDKRRIELFNQGIFDHEIFITLQKLFYQAYLDINGPNSLPGVFLQTLQPSASNNNVNTTTTTPSSQPPPSQPNPVFRKGSIVGGLPPKERENTPDSVPFYKLKDYYGFTVEDYWSLYLGNTIYNPNYE